MIKHKYNEHGQKLDMSNAKVEHGFAWLPVLIRESDKWVWLKKYTRYSVWSPTLERFRTIHTALGHVKFTNQKEQGE